VAFTNSFAPMWVIGLCVGVMVALLIFDVVVLGRRPHVPSNKETGLALGVYVSLAIAFGVYVWIAGGGQLGGEYFAGWLTEYSLSIDNLFVFIIIMAKLGVPRQYQQYALLIGIVIALVLRAIFILVGAQAINAAAWVFYIFGAILIYTAVKMLKEFSQHGEEDDAGNNKVVQFAKERLPFTDSWEHGTKVKVLDSTGARVYTPMFLVILALGTTDLLFALDSIPAIFGLTQDPFLVLMANIFALMGLRQLYFLIGGLLKKLVYLSLGLSVLLIFIGIKLMLHALHENNLPFINGGEPIHGVPDIPIWLSLSVIIGILVITAIASLLKTRRDESQQEESAESPAER
jgi:tellurite resistance protein TerC